jgi:hypothetical protein
VAGIAVSACLVQRSLDPILAAPFAPTAPHGLKPLKHDADVTPEWIAAQRSARRRLGALGSTLTASS